MRNFVIIFLGLLFISSCCKRRAAESFAAVRIEYASLTDRTILYHIQTERGNFSNVIDTTELELSSVSKHSYLLDFEEGQNDHILMMADSSFIDTLSNISFNRDKCDDIENTVYYHNGIYKTDYELIIK